ncbi:SCO7613 C-terminal domain-containing membrane protein [Geodermatophilus sp. CPCC 206100]|uniref:SCO7613 C-terminal domain-containing membrane protein n=1 Tax=Geodermatophilus sp. CPCC 206100 TaxID=3020054 RepID=UPI003AFF6F19
MGDAPLPPPLPYRIRGLEWLLTVGVVLVATAGAGLTAVVGGNWVRVLLLGLAAAAALASWFGAVGSLRRTEEACATAAVALTAIGIDPRGPVLTGSVEPPVVAGAVFAVLAFLLPRPAAWPLAAWLAAQVAVLRAADGVPEGLPEMWLAVGTALAGLATAGLARPLVARVALLTALPWWTAGVVGAVAVAWTGAGPGRWVPVAASLASATGLLAVRQRPTLRRLLRPPGAVPVLAGIAVGATVGAALHSPGAVPVPLAGYLGVTLASAAAALLTGAVRRVLLPPVVWGSTTLVVLCLVQLLADARWIALAWLFGVTAAFSLGTALLRASERPTAVPTAVACGGLSALCTVPLGGPPALRTAAVALTALYLLALVAGLGMETRTRRPTAATGAACAVACAALLVAMDARGQLAAHLTVQGAATTAWAWAMWFRARTATVSRPLVAVPQPAVADEAGDAAEGWSTRLADAARAAAGAGLGAVRRLRRAAQGAIGVPRTPPPAAAPEPIEEPTEAAAPAAPAVAAEPPTSEERIAAAEASPAWRAGAAQLVLAAWQVDALTGVRVLEAYTLPLAVGLLLAAGPRVATERSAPVWGPALWVAAAPSVTWAVLAPGSERPVWVFVVAATAMAVGAWRSVRAPVVAGAATAVTLALGLLAAALPLPVGGALVVGGVLVGVGAWRERLLRRRRQDPDDGGVPDPADGFPRRLADMR